MFDWIPSVLSATFAAGGAYAAVRVELRALRRDVDRNEAETKTLHSRINRLIESLSR